MSHALEPAEYNRAPFRPSDDQRRVVVTMAAYQVPHEKIAAALGVHKQTLLKHFRSELGEGIGLTIAKLQATCQRLQAAQQDGDSAPAG